MLLAVIFMFIALYCIYYFYVVYFGKKEVSLPEGIPQEKIKFFYHSLSYHFLIIGVFCLACSIIAMLEIINIWFLVGGALVVIVVVAISIVLLYRQATKLYAME